MQPKLSIITINYNNASGLRKTMESVCTQTSEEFEYLIIDGGSDDGSIDVIIEFESFNNHPIGKSKIGSNRIIWKSEPDKGIYHAMNKGIMLSRGEYIHFVNSGDVLVSASVTKSMLDNLTDCDLLYGNMLKELSSGKMKIERRISNISFLTFFDGALNHPVVYTKRTLFDRFGLYDESLKIVSDWKWILNVVVFNGIEPYYVNVDVTLFDLTGTSSVNKELEKAERRQVLEEFLPLTILRDYELNSFPIEQLRRMNRYWLTRNLFWFVERILFKYEKWFWNMKLKY